MLNFIITKAMAKELDDRYQNAKDFADDLRACRNALPRPSAQANKTKPQSASPSAPIPNAILAKKSDVDAEESKPVANMGLSSNFDSFEATMRMAALTAPEEAEEIGKTLRMKRPSMETINQAAPRTAKPRRAASAATIPMQTNNFTDTDTPHNSNSGKLMMLIMVLLILLGLTFIL